MQNAGQGKLGLGQDFRSLHLCFKLDLNLHVPAIVQVAAQPAGCLRDYSGFECKRHLRSHQIWEGHRTVPLLSAALPPMLRSLSKQSDGDLTSPINHACLRSFSTTTFYSD
jgi:hypothetical protein